MKSRNFFSELKGLSVEELRAKAVAIAEELMKLRFRQASGQFEQAHRFRELKKNLARVETLLTQKSGTEQAKTVQPQT